MSNTLQPHGLQHARLPCLPLSPSLLKFMFIELVMLPNHLILCRPLLLLPSVFLFIRVFSNESALCIKLVKSSSQLILCCPLLLLPQIPPSIRVFPNESTLCMRWPKYWSFSLSISPFSEHLGLVSFRMDWLDLLAVQGTLKSLQKHQFFGAQLSSQSNSHIHT